MNIHMDIHIWVPRDPWGGSMDTLGGPMGPWDRWDLGLMDPRYFLRGYFLRVVYRYPAQPGPARPGPARPARPARTGTDSTMEHQKCTIRTTVRILHFELDS